MGSIANCNSLPENLQSLLHKLEYFAMLKVNMKPCMSDMTFVEKDSWMGALHRYRFGENKKNLMVHVGQLVDESIRAINDYKDTEFLTHIVNALSNAKNGLSTLLTTYQDYPDTIAQVKVYLRNIDLQLEKNKSVLHGHTKEPQRAIVFQSSAGFSQASHFVAPSLQQTNALQQPPTTSLQQPSLSTSAVNSTPIALNPAVNNASSNHTSVNNASAVQFQPSPAASTNYVNTFPQLPTPSVPAGSNITAQKHDAVKEKEAISNNSASVSNHNSKANVEHTSNTSSSTTAVEKPHHKERAIYLAPPPTKTMEKN